MESTALSADERSNPTTEDHTEDPSPVNSTFVADHIALQRNPSTARSLQSTASGAKSMKSVGSDSTSTSRAKEEDERIDIKRSQSVASTVSAGSAKSIRGLGGYAFGSLHVHKLDSPTTETPPAAPETSPCLAAGDVIVVDGMPRRIFVGIDNIALTITEETPFRGVRDLPPGWHFLYAGASSALSTRSGFWVYSQARDASHHGRIFVKRWDAESETLDDEIMAEAMFQRNNVAKLHDKLFAYGAAATMTHRRTAVAASADALPAGMPLPDPQLWQTLTSAITADVLHRITGNPFVWRVTSNHDTKPALFKNGDTICEAFGDGLPDLASGDRIFTFLLPRGSRIFTELAVGRARTEQALDSSSYVERACSERKVQSADELVGELQFTFVTGMLLGNLACMQQWQHTVQLLFKAYAFALAQPTAFARVIDTVHAQLQWDETALDGSIFDHDGDARDDLQRTLTIFKSRLNERLLAAGAALTPPQKAVGDAFERLEAWLWGWGWDLRANYLRQGPYQLEDGEFVDLELAEFEDEDERGEYAPVVVDLDDEGRERGLVQL